MYTGHLLTTSPPWIRVAHGKVGQDGDNRIGFLVPKDAPPMCTGDPVFFLENRRSVPAILFHANVSFFYSPAKYLEVATKWGGMLSLSNDLSVDDLFPNLSPLDGDSEVSFIALSEPKPIFPPIALDRMRQRGSVPTEYSECTEHEVLWILKSLPMMAQTAWTRRVVARNNDL